MTSEEASSLVANWSRSADIGREGCRMLAEEFDVLCGLGENALLDIEQDDVRAVFG